MNTQIMLARGGGECCQPLSPRLPLSLKLQRTSWRSRCGTAAALCAKAVKNVAITNTNFQ